MGEKDRINAMPQLKGEDGEREDEGDANATLDDAHNDVRHQDVGDVVRVQEVSCTSTTQQENIQ